MTFWSHIFLYVNIIYFVVGSLSVGRSKLTANEQRLCEGTALKNFCSAFAQMYNRITNVELLTSAVLLQNRCCVQPFFSS
jgi:low affinity Fe/Cu permease